MDMVPTLDILLGDTAADKARIALVARSAVSAAVADWSALRALERELGAGDELAGEGRSVAIAFHRQHEAWKAAAEPLWQRIKAVSDRVGPVAGAEQLRDALGRTTARLSVPLASLIRSAEDGLYGRERRFASVEEMRRELLHTDVPRRSLEPISTDGPVAAGGSA